MGAKILHDYPEDADIYTCIGAVQAKPFARTFDEQVEAANDLYGSYLKLSFHKKDVTELLKSLQGFYSEGLLRRVEGIAFLSRNFPFLDKQKSKKHTPHANCFLPKP